MVIFFVFIAITYITVLSFADAISGGWSSAESADALRATSGKLGDGCIVRCTTANLSTTERRFRPCRLMQHHLHESGRHSYSRHRSRASGNSTRLPNYGRVERDSVFPDAESSRSPFPAEPAKSKIPRGIAIAVLAQLDW
jgi:hypothetical protein